MDRCWYDEPIASLPRPSLCDCDFCVAEREKRKQDALPAPRADAS